MSNAAQRLGVPPRLVGAMVLGTLLNPLNASMIAVALVELQREFDVGVAQSTWLISAFYLTAAVGQPVMGRLIDLYGARRLYMAGMALTAVTCAVAPFAPGFWWLVAARAIQGIGTSAAYPAALVSFRSNAPAGSAPTGAIAIVGIVAGGSAALGPVVGGILIALFGWQAIFVINVPLALIALVAARRALPANDRQRRSTTQVVREIDIPGVLLFTATVATLVMFFLSLAGNPNWILAPVVVVSAVALVARELTVAEPFLDVRYLARNRELSSLLLQQGGINLVFYLIFFGLPMWLQSVRGLSVGTVGLMMLPLAAVSVAALPVASRALRSRGVRPVLIAGAIVIVVSTLALQLLTATTSLVLLIAIVTVLGAPNGFANLALQSGLFTASSSERMGASSGLFQTFRYLGAILASSVLGVLLERNLSSDGLHNVGWVATATGLGLAALAFTLPRVNPR